MDGNNCDYQRSSSLLTPEHISDLVGRNISGFQILRGRNNQVAKFLLDDKQLICKTFLQSDGSERYKREIGFLNYCLHSQISMVPSLFASFDSELTLITEFIDGAKPAKVTGSLLQSLCLFIEQINSSFALQNAGELSLAADALTDEFTLYRDIEQRIRSLRNEQHESIQRLVDSLEVSALQIGNLEISLVSELHHLRAGTAHGIFVSPSDIGLHNTIAYNNGFKYIDFEYAGIDSPVKLYLDICYQPDFNLSKQEMLLIYRYLKHVLGFQLQDLSETLRLSFVIKWCLIMLKSASDLVSQTNVISYARNHGLDIG
jgi:hypothetical protein